MTEGSGFNSKTSNLTDRIIMLYSISREFAESDFLVGAYYFSKFGFYSHRDVYVLYTIVQIIVQVTLLYA